MTKEIAKLPTKAELKQITALRGQSLNAGNVLMSIGFPKLAGITNWEELECLGYNPELSQIEAVVNIKQNSGYSGNLCSNGSPEFVRFFIDYNDGNGFEDLGLSSFRAYNISDEPPGPQHPISYLVNKKINVAKNKKFCSKEVLVTLRAVLSWNAIPSNNPNEVPVYGNVLETEAILKPIKFLIPNFPPFFEKPDLDVEAPDIPDLIDGPIIDLPVSPITLPVLPQPKPVDVKEFIKKNMANGISSSRTVSQVMAMALPSSNTDILNQFQQFDFGEMGIDIDDLVQGLNSKDFNVGYEEIVSVGLNPAQDVLGAIINIKNPFGYGGNLCSNGSLEYVSFYADFNNNGTFERYLGTTSVQVNDINSIPDEGLMYAVYLKTDLSKYLKECGKPQVVRLRAILSWATPPAPNNAEQQVNWGNRMDTLVQLRPRKANQTSIIYSIGNVAIDEIDETTGLAFSGNSGRGNNRPWAGNIIIEGGIDNSGAPGTTKYRVEYSQNGVDFYPVTLKQQIRTIDFSNPFNPFTTHTLANENGWFPYLANHNAANLVTIEDQLLAVWPSHAFEGTYYIRVSYTKDDPIANPASIQHSNVFKIRLDNKRFNVDNTPNNTIDAQFDVDMKVDGGVCKVYKQGDQITGNVKVKDAYYGGYNLSVQPATQIIDANGLITYAPSAILNNAAITETGPLNDVFTVDTAKLNKCGYTLRLRGYERTILNSNVGHFPFADKYVGFSVV